MLLSSWLSWGLVAQCHFSSSLNHSFYESSDTCLEYVVQAGLTDCFYHKSGLLGWCGGGRVCSRQRVRHQTTFLPSKDSQHWAHGRWCWFYFIIVVYLHGEALLPNPLAPNGKTLLLYCFRHKNSHDYAWDIAACSDAIGRIKDVDVLHSHILTAWDKLDLRIIDTAVRQWRMRLRVCVKAKGTQTEPVV